MAIKTFKNKGTYEIAKGEQSKIALKLLPVELHRSARVKLAQLDATDNLMDLRSMRGLNLEKLKGERKGQWSVRINKQYRITFVWKNGDFFDVCVEDYH